MDFLLQLSRPNNIIRRMNLKLNLKKIEKIKMLLSNEIKTNQISDKEKILGNDCLEKMI